MKKICLVTGANQGLGLAIAKRLAVDGNIVYATARSSKGLLEIQKSVSGKISNGVIPLLLDVTNDLHISEMVKQIEQRYGRLDMLINNAGIYLDDPRKTHYASLLDLDVSLFEKTLQTNLIGALKLIWAFLPVMVKNRHGRIVNVSSGMSRFEDFNNMSPFYRISKTGLNALTKIISCEVAPYDILVNAVCPGWVRTNMGGENAPREVEDAVDGILWAAYLPVGGPSGCFFRDGNPLDWCSKGERK